MGMTVNSDKKKIMIIKSKKDTYANFIYGNRNLEEVNSYNYIGIDIHHKLNWNYSIEKMIILVLKITVNQPIWSHGIKISSSLKLLSSLLSCMVVKYGGATFLENLGGRLSKSRSGL